MKAVLGLTVLSMYLVASVSFAADKVAINQMKLVNESGSVAQLANADFGRHHHHHHHHHHHWSGAKHAVQAAPAPVVSLE